MPPMMIGCSIAKSSVILVFMLYLLNEVKLTHSVSMMGLGVGWVEECRQTPSWRSNLPDYGGLAPATRGAARAVFPALISPQRLPALHRRAEYPFLRLPWCYSQP